MLEVRGVSVIVLRLKSPTKFKSWKRLVPVHFALLLSEMNEHLSFSLIPAIYKLAGKTVVFGFGKEIYRIEGTYSKFISKGTGVW